MDRGMDGSMERPAREDTPEEAIERARRIAVLEEVLGAKPKRWRRVLSYVFVVLVGVGCLNIGVQYFVQEDALGEHSAVAEARVVELDIHRVDTLEVEFEVDGETVTTEVDRGRSGAEEGDRVEVRYDLLDPERARLADQGEAARSFGVLWILGALLLWGGLWGYRALSTWSERKSRATLERLRSGGAVWTPSD